MSDSEQEETSQLLCKTSIMEARHDHQLAKRFRFLHGITTLVGIFDIILVFIWVFHYRGGVGITNPQTEFNWHPLLMVIGFIFLYAQAILIYRAARYTLKRPLKLIHAIIHIIVFIIVVLALKAVFDSHNYAKTPIPNMYSLHSWIGLVAVILFSCQYVVGFITYLFPGVSLDLRKAYMHVHTSFGTIGFFLAITAALMGLTEKGIFNGKYSELGPEAMLINFIGIFLAIFGALVLYLINENTYKRVPLPEDDMLLSSSPIPPPENN